MRIRSVTRAMNSELVGRSFSVKVSTPISLLNAFVRPLFQATVRAWRMERSTLAPVVP